MKKYSKFIIFFLLTFLLFIIVRITEPKGIDWSLSFSKDDKIPYGSFILYNVLPELFPDENIRIPQYPVYNILKDKAYKNSNYIFINNTFAPDELDIKELLDYVSEGNNVFVAANFIRGKLSDTLKVATNLSYIGNDSIKVNFSNSELKNDFPYVFKDSPLDYFFTDFDTAKTIALGFDNDNKTNFIKIKFGKGNFYLNAVPIAFTNYNMLDSLNSGYVFKSLSYLPVSKTVFWDEYYKTGRGSVRTPLRFILSTQPLKWAYYLLIFSILFYIIFEGKRKQRIIPEINPLQNSTLEFAGIIGKLYYHRKNHKNIAEKKIRYLLDQIRSRYYIRMDEITEDTIEKISIRSGVELKEVKSIFKYISYIEILPKVKEKELKHINLLIESFYKKEGIYGRAE
ncbi:MAG: DUF4350 domain-containing protein [Ignavibacteriaceae bacterium]